MSTRFVGPWFSRLAKLLLTTAVVGVAAYKIFFAPLTVDTVKVGRGGVVAEVMGTGTLEAHVKVAISPRISGRLVQVLVDQGDRVKQGQLLATLDDGDLRQQVAMARSELAATKAAVDRASADAARAEAIAHRALTELNRLAQLSKQNLLAAVDLDKGIEQREVADANIRSTKAALIEAQRQVNKAEESHRYYEERLADTRIVAPFDGLVVRRARDPGDVLVTGGTILDIVSTKELWISAWVDETAMGAISPGQPARVIFRSDPEKPYPGKVVRLSPQTDRETRELCVDVAVTALPRVWAIGQRAEVYVETGRKEGVLVLPQRIILWRAGQSGVLVAADNRARWQKVAMGVRGHETAEITQGLTEGQLLIAVSPDGEAPREGRALHVR